jgi:hypothetical protein
VFRESEGRISAPLKIAVTAVSMQNFENFTSEKLRD